MYLLMERASFGQIQTECEGEEGNLVEKNLEIFNIAKDKGRKLWPSDSKINDLEIGAKWIFHQVAEAMSHLHNSMNIVHRDLKYANILMGLRSADPMSEFERQPTIKVCDFTTAAVLPTPNSKIAS